MPIGARPRTAIHPIERSLPPADRLALDPLGPIAPPPDEHRFRPAH